MIYLVLLISVLILGLLHLLDDTLIDSISLGKSNLGLALFSNDSHIRAPSGELVTGLIPDSDKIVVSVELVDRLDDADSSDVVSLVAVGDVSNLHFVDGVNGAGLEVELDGVLDLDLLAEELEGSSVVGGEVADLVGSDEFLLDSAELEVLLLSLELDEFEPSLDVVEDSVGFVELGDVDDVHEAAGILGVSSDLLIDDEESLFLVENGVDLGGVEGDAEFVSEDDLNWDGLSELMGTLGGSDSIDAS